MAELKGDTLCKYCLGCNKLMNINYIGIRSCKKFAPGYENWREMYDKAIQENLNSGKK